MKKLLLIALGLLMVSSLIWAEESGIIGSPVSTWCVPDKDSHRILSGELIVPTKDEIRLWRLINAVRAKPDSAGWPQYEPAPPLWMNYNLTDAARFHSQEMIDNNYFDHDSKDASGNSYETFDQRIRRFGYKPEGWIDENIAGCATVDIAMNLWLGSTGHRENILNKEYSEIGIGIKNGGPYGKMFTTDFGYRSLSFDLTITDPDSDLWWQPSGEAIIVSALITNTGKTHAFPVYVAFYDGDPRQGGELIAVPESIPFIIPNGEKGLAKVSWVPTTGGQHQVFVVIDPDDNFDETNENNNTASLPVMVGLLETALGSKSISPAIQCRPNPAVSEALIEYSLNRETPVTLAIYNSAGQLVKLLARGTMRAGKYQLVWNGNDDSGKVVPSGVYFLRLETSDSLLMKKIVFVTSKKYKGHN